MKNCRIILFILVLIFSLLGIFSCIAIAADTTAPSVANTTPANGSTIKELNKYSNHSEILVTFSEPITDVSRTTAGSISVVGVGGDVGFYSQCGTYADGKTLQILSNQEYQILKPGIYKVYINKGYFQDAAGNVNDAYSFCFTIAEADTTAPSVASTRPANGDVIKELPKYNNHSEILVVFSEPITDVSRTTTGSISVKDSSGNDVGFYSMCGDGKTLKILSNQENQILKDGKYTVSINKGYFADEAGNVNDSYSFTFAIVADTIVADTVAPSVASTRPANGDVIKELPKYNNHSEILVVFSEPITDVSRTTAGSISVKDASGIDVGFYSECGDGKTLKILSNQENQILKDGKYTVSINKGYFMDEAGNVNDSYSFTFAIVADTIVADTVAPSVASTRPANGDVIKELPKYNNHSEILVVFSEPITDVSRTTAGSISVAGVGGDVGFYSQCGTYADGKTLQILSNQEYQILKPGIYKVYINKGYFQDAAGNVNDAYSFCFTVAEADTTAPSVASTTPANGSTIKELNKYNNHSEILVVFSEPITDVSRTTAGSISVVGVGGDVGFYSQCGTYADGKTLQILSNQEYQILKPGIYKVYINKGYFQDAAGNVNDSYSFCFTVAEADTTLITGFSDMSKSHWAYNSVMEMASRGVICGNSDGTFKPNDNVTREQFAKMMVLALNLPLTNPATPTFKDMNQDYWAYKYVESAKSYLTGYQKADGMYYKGRTSAVREDMAYALVKAKGLDNQSVDVTRLSTLFSDASKITQTLQKYVLIAYDNGIMKGYANNTFGPKGTLTRAEAAQLLYNVLVINEGDDTDKTIVE